MKQITLHDVHKATKATIEGWMPFQIVCDGEVIAIVTSPYDVHKPANEKPKATHDVHKTKHDVTQADKADFKKSLCRHGLIYCSKCK